MTQEEKYLLLQDLCARLPYGVKCQFEDKVRVTDGESSPFYDYALSAHHLDLFMRHNNFYIKPYLRPLSSMTEEEAIYIAILHGYNFEDILSIKVTDEYIDIILNDGACYAITSTIWFDEIISSLECFDYLNKKMFNYRGLPEDLVLSTDKYNPYKD